MDSDVELAEGASGRRKRSSGCGADVIVAPVGRIACPATWSECELGVLLAEVLSRRATGRGRAHGAADAKCFPFEHPRW